MKRKILIVGGGAAGCAAASFARKTDKDTEIIIIDSEKNTGYSRCGLPYVMEGDIPKYEDLIQYDHKFFKFSNINVMTETRVIDIDPKSKFITIKDLKGNTDTIDYDSLILTTGAKPYIPPIEGIDKDGVFTVRTIEDCKQIEDKIKNGTKKAVIVGGGTIGLEFAAALKSKDLDITLVELLPHLLPRIMDSDMAHEVEESLIKNGVNVVKGKSVETISGRKKVEGVILSNGEEIQTDIVIIATGVKPNIDLGVKIGAEIGWGIRVNNRMEIIPKHGVEFSDIYAAGDVCETRHLLTGGWIVPCLGTIAVRQGKIAGINAAGGDSTYDGTLGSWVSKIFDMEIGGTGLTELAAEREGFDIVARKVTSVTKPHYWPNGSKIKVKLIAERDSGRLLGAQLIGGEDVAQRINVLSLALQKRMDVYELAKVDTCYAPPVADTWEPFVLAADVVIKKMAKQHA